MGGDATDEKKAQIREEVFTESFPLGQKQRFGLFSQPCSTAIADDNYYIPKKARRDADGAVIIDPRNFTTKNVKKGRIDSVLFSRPNYTCLDDPFKEASKVPMRTVKKDGFKEAGHDFNFKPCKSVPRKVTAAFEHVGDFKEVKKCYKGPDGVIIGPTNFLTNPPKRGVVGKNTTFSGMIPYKEDPYNRKRELEKKDHEYHLSKLQEKPFSQKVKGRETFATIKEAYGEDREYLARKAAPKTAPLMVHDVPFKPSNPAKRGYNKAIEKKFVYIEDPLKPVLRKKTTEGEEDRGRWRSTHKYKSRPTPSVVTSMRNLKTEFPSVYRRMC